MLQDAQELFSKGGINLVLFIFFFYYQLILCKDFGYLTKIGEKHPLTCFRFSIAMYDVYKLVWAPHYLSLLQGYVTAWCEEGGVLNMVLLKYFRKEMKEDWNREVGVVQSLSCDEQLLSNVLHYRWHCKSKWPYFFQCNNQFRIAINFSHHFWNPRLLHRSLFHTDDFSLLLENNGGGVGVDIWTLFREFKGVVLNFWSFCCCCCCCFFL